MNKKILIASLLALSSFSTAQVYDQSILTPISQIAQPPANTEPMSPEELLSKKASDVSAAQQPEVLNDVKELQKKEDEVKVNNENKKPPKDVGYVWASKIEDPDQQLRQSGKVIHSPIRSGWYSNPSILDELEMNKFIYKMNEVGIEKKKVIFEAERRSKEDFKKWMAGHIEAYYGSDGC